MSDTYTLLIWEMVPEETYLYLIPTAEANKYKEFLNEAHGKLINNNDWNDGLRFLNSALAENEDEVEAEDGFEQYLCVLSQFKWKSDQPIVDRTITAVYLSGFVL